MRQELLNLHRELNATFLFVTHDQIEALTLADLLIVMDNGIIQQIGTPQEIYAFPQNEFVAKFIGSSAINLIEDVTLNKLSDSRFSCSLLGKEVTFDIEDKNNENAEYIVDIGIRPEDFEISTTNKTEYIIKSCEFFGDTYLYVCESIEKNDMLLRVKSNKVYKINESVSLKFKPYKLHLFEKISKKRIKLMR